MSTRSNIGYEKRDGTIVAVYCHFDGYPDGVGKDLVDYTYEEAIDLVNQGDMSYIGEPYTSRGESYKDNAPQEYPSIESALGECYIYVCRPDGTWVTLIDDKVELLEDVLNEED